MPRTQKNIDPVEVESLVKLGCPASDIADHFGVSESTIRRRFKSLLLKARAGRRINLRVLQWKVAKDGNVPMLIFLGKDELGQGQEAKEMESKTIVRRLVERSKPIAPPTPEAELQATPRVLLLPAQ